MSRTLMTRTLKGIAYTLGGAGLMLVVLTLFTAGHGDRSLYPPPPDEPQVTVYVKYSAMHANLVVPTEELWRHAEATALAMQSVEMTQEPWTVLGWGDLWYYRERGKTQRRLRDFARSMLRPNNPSVVFISPSPAPPTPENSGRQVVRLALSPAGFEKLVARLDSSFLLEADAPVIRGRGREPGSWFFASHEGSDLTHVCNHWIGHLLDAAGVPVTPVTDTLSHSLGWSLRWRAGAEVIAGNPDDHVRPPETPPAHSGRYDAQSPPAQAISTSVTFETYRISFGDSYLYDTAPVRLAQAREPSGAGQENFAALMDVPSDSLIEIRRVISVLGAEAGAALCEDSPAEFIVTGFRERPDDTFEIVLAAFAGAHPPGADSDRANLCGVYDYRQR